MVEHLGVMLGILVSARGEMCEFGWVWLGVWSGEDKWRLSR